MNLCGGDGMLILTQMDVFNVFCKILLNRIPFEIKAVQFKIYQESQKLTLQIWTLLLCSIFFIISPTTVCCILKACRNEFKLRAPEFALWWDIMGRKACRCPWGEESSPGNFLKFGYVLMPFVALRNPLRSAFSWQLRSLFECDSHQNATRTNGFPFRN